MSAERGDLPPLRGGIFLVSSQTTPAKPDPGADGAHARRRTSGTKGRSLIASLYGCVIIILIRTLCFDDP